MEPEKLLALGYTPEDAQAMQLMLYERANKSSSDSEDEPLSKLTAE